MLLTSTGYVVVTVIAAAWVGFSAFSLLREANFVTRPLVEYGVPRSWWPWLGTAKGFGAAGLLLGLVVPAIGVLAAVCLLLYFSGAVVTIVRAHSYSHIVNPVMYMVPVTGALVGLAS